MRPYSKPLGFTFIEILIVFFIVAVLSALLAPVLIQSPHRTLQDATREVTTALRETRRIAVIEGSRSSFVMDTETGHLGSDSADRHRRLPDGMTGQMTTAQTLLQSDSTGRIDFFPNGSSTGGQILLGFGDRSVQIDVEWLIGKILVGPVTP
jgi:general secretion pathway protein H